MKVIDLLNKIANNEEIPIKIKIGGYEFRQSNGQFWCDKLESYMINSCTSIYRLNDEIEIIEEKPKKIEELEEVREITQDCFDNWTCAKRINQLNENQKKIIKAVNYLLEKESDK